MQNTEYRIQYARATECNEREYKICSTAAPWLKCSGQIDSGQSTEILTRWKNQRALQNPDSDYIALRDKHTLTQTQTQRQTDRLTPTKLPPPQLVALEFLLISIFGVLTRRWHGCCVWDFWAVFHQKCSVVPIGFELTHSQRQRERERLCRDESARDSQLFHQTVSFYLFLSNWTTVRRHWPTFQIGCLAL